MEGVGASRQSLAPDELTDTQYVMSCPSFLNHSDPIPGTTATVRDFWQWAYSDTLSNRNRSVFAEFLVGLALGVLESPRIEWDAVDLRYCGHTLEVKSAAYRQSWPQKKPSRICFDIRKKIPWDSATGESGRDAVRSADVYVFCLFAAKDLANCNVLDARSWEFYVLPTAMLNRYFPEAKSMSLADVKARAVKCGFDCLRAVVADSLPSCRSIDAQTHAEKSI